MRARLLACLLCLPAAAGGAEEAGADASTPQVDASDALAGLARADRLALEAARDASKPVREALAKVQERLAGAQRVLGRPDPVQADLWSELGRADLHLSQAQAEEQRPDAARKITQARSEVSVAREALARRLGALTAPASEPTRRGPPQPMPEEALQSLLGVADHESWDDLLAALDAGTKDHLLAPAQAKAVLARLPFTHLKLMLARRIQDRLAEPKALAQLEAAFPFDSDRVALRTLLAGGAVAPPRPQDPSEASQLVARVKEGFAASIAQQVLREEVPRRYFTVDQLSRLLGAFPTFEARLRALETVRPHVLDPDEWQSLEPHFATMPDRARLRSLFAADAR